MPPGEEMFNFHGYSGPCPKPPLPKRTGWPINLTCPKCGTQTICTPADYTYEMAKDFAGLLDGSSPMFVAGNPIGDPTTQIGKCATCGSQIHASLPSN